MANMTKENAISIAFEIKENPTGHDFSSYLYSAVGMIKLSPDAGTAYAAHLLAEAISEASPNLSAFCQRKIDIIEKHYTERMGKMLEIYVDACAKLDYEASVRMMQGM